MGQIIDLLTNLFKLTKVAAVTLPGLAAAGVLALLFWLPPVDVIPVAEKKFLQPPEKPKIPYSIEQQLPSPTVPGLGRDADQAISAPATSSQTGAPACTVTPFILSDLNDCDDCTAEKSKVVETDRKILATAVPDLDVDRLLPRQDGKFSPSYIRDRRARQQYLLDFEKDALTACAEVEDSWRGQEEAKNSLLAADLTNLDKQRGDIQDAYTGYLKTNNPLAEKSRANLQHILNEIERNRQKTLENSRSIKERERRSAELKREAGIITERLADAGRLRPRKTFDDYLAGLVNHVVGLILLSLALSLIITAIDRATFDSIHEYLFVSLQKAKQAGPHGQASPVLLGEMLTWIIGLVAVIVLGILLYCVPDYSSAKLLAALIAGLTGIAFGHWLVRRDNEKGLKAETADFDVNKPLEDLGFFDRRLKMRDERLLLSPSQLQEQYEKGQEEKKQFAIKQEQYGWEQEQFKKEQAEKRPTTPPQPPAQPKKPQTPPPQVLQPRYAIGKGIITQEEYQNLKDNYFAQSELSFGLILPTLLLVFALGTQQLQLCLPAWLFPCLLVFEILATMVLFLVGMEREEKFGMEFRMLILGHWDKLNEAAAQSTAAKPKPDLSDLRKAVSDALSKMQLQVKPLVVELRSEPTARTTTPTTHTTAPTTPPSPQGGSGQDDKK